LGKEIYCEWEKEEKIKMAKKKKMVRTRIYQRPDGIWKATIGFKNNYTRKGASETFDTKNDANAWVKGIRAFNKRRKR